MSGKASGATARKASRAARAKEPAKRRRFGARSGRATDAILWRRVGKAVAAIAVAAVVCCGIGGVVDAWHGATGAQELVAAAQESLTTQEGSSDRAGDAAAQLPDGFQEEVLDVGSRAELRVGADGSVVGFTEQGNAAEVYSALKQDLEGRSWREAESGRDDCGSFVKDGGSFTWLFVSCVQVGDAASVVIYCPSAAEGSD